MKADRHGFAILGRSHTAKRHPKDGSESAVAAAGRDAAAANPLSMGAIPQHPLGLGAVRAALLPFVLCAGLLGFMPTASIAAPSTPSAAADAKAADTAAVDGARKRVAAGDLKGAIAALADYVAAHPHTLEPARYLGDLYYRHADYAAAERTYRTILRDSPDDRQTHNQLGGVYAFEDRIPDAISEFTKSLPLPSAFEYLVDLHRRRGDLDAFVAPFRRDADERPNDPGAQLSLGTLYHSMHRNQEAANYLERALQLEPRACPVLSEIGSTYLDLSRYGSALDTLQRCLSIEPDDYSALVNLGDAYIARDDPAAALPLFEHANRVRPDGPEAIIDLGYLEDVDGHWREAVADYLKALAIQPLSLDAYNNLGYDYDVHHLYPQAEAAYLKGLSVSPDDGRLHFLLGRTYAEQDKHDLAREQYRLAELSDQADVAQAARQQLASQ